MPEPDTETQRMMDAVAKKQGRIEDLEGLVAKFTAELARWMPLTEKLEAENAYFRGAAKDAAEQFNIAIVQLNDSRLETIRAKRQRDRLLEVLGMVDVQYGEDGIWLRFPNAMVNLDNMGPIARKAILAWAEHSAKAIAAEEETDGKQT